MLISSSRFVSDHYLKDSVQNRPVAGRKLPLFEFAPTGFSSRSLAAACYFGGFLAFVSFVGSSFVFLSLSLSS